MKKLYVTHKTNYSFEAGPLSGLQQIKKTPYSDSCQMVLDWSLSLKGAKEELSFIDSFNNNVHLIRFRNKMPMIYVFSCHYFLFFNIFQTVLLHINPLPNAICQTVCPLCISQAFKMYSISYHIEALLTLP